LKPQAGSTEKFKKHQTTDGLKKREDKDIDHIGGGGGGGVSGQEKKKNPVKKKKNSRKMITG